MTEPAEPTPSSTVLLLRGGPAGLEVLMLERSLRSDFVGGAWVFPGGKVDALDATLPGDRWRGPDPVEDAARLGLPDAAAALGSRVAAVRETFEEAGVLLASRADGRPVTADDLRAASFVAARAALNERGADVGAWFDWLAAEDLVLDLGELTPWSWWVTPVGLHRRFDTRFFVATLPAAQRDVARHDEVETTGARWTTPPAALGAHAAGEVTVIFPTRCNLRDLEGHATPRAAAAAARDAGPPPRTEPWSVTVDGVDLVQHPDGRAPEPV